MPTAVYGGASAPAVPEQTNVLVRRHAGVDARIGIETGDMTPGLMNELRNLGLEVGCLDARHARAALQIRPSNPFAATS